MRYVLYNHIGSGNHGCEALVRTISSLLGEDKTCLLSEFVGEEEKYGINQIIKVYPAISKVKKNFLYLKAYYQLKVRKNYFYMDILPYLNAIDQLKEDDVLVSIGGDIFCYDNYPKYVLLHQYALKRIKNTILLGCSIEPENLKDESFLDDLKSYKIITTREHITYNALIDKGLKNVIYCPDSAFTLKKQDVSMDPIFISNNTVGLNISPLVLKKSTNSQLILENYSRLMKYIIDNTDMNIALIPHVVWNNNDDRVPLTQLYELYKDTKRVCLIDDCNCMQLKNVISQCSYFVGARTHATIAAYSSGVPTLVLGYSVKSKGIAEDLFGTSDGYVLSYKDISNEDDLINAFSYIENNCEKIIDSLKTKQYEIVEIVKNSYRKIQDSFSK